MIMRKRIKNAEVLMAQPKETSWMRRDTMIGKRTPPSEDPAAANPIAMPLFLKNQVEQHARDGVKIIEAPIALQTP